MRLCSGLLLLATLVPGCSPAQDRGPRTDRVPRNGFSHRLLDAVLRAHVDDRGRVDYRGVGDDERFRRYVASLADVDLAALPSDRHRLAFWINAYNALTVHGILSRLPPDPRAWPAFKPTQIKVAGKSFWQGVRFRVAGRKLTLDEIEHKMIRANPAYRDPRVHVALVCAARGCPALMNRAYDGARLAAQLEARFRREMNDPARTRLDRRHRVVRLSRVFAWYRSDFTDRAARPRADSLGAFVARYLEDREAARGLAAGRWRIEFYPYDWRLNVKP